MTKKMQVSDLSSGSHCGSGIREVSVHPRCPEALAIRRLSAGGWALDIKVRSQSSGHQTGSGRHILGRRGNRDAAGRGRCRVAVVIVDESGNIEFVWVEAPKTVLFGIVEIILFGIVRGINIRLIV
jgi:hypothetical protein